MHGYTVSRINVWLIATYTTPACTHLTHWTPGDVEKVTSAITNMSQVKFMNIYSEVVQWMLQNTFGDKQTWFT